MDRKVEMLIDSLKLQDDDLFLQSRQGQNIGINSIQYIYKFRRDGI